MVERGEVSLDDPVAKFFLLPPAVKGTGARGQEDSRWADLATQTSGLPRIAEQTSSRRTRAIRMPTTVVDRLYAFSLLPYTDARDPGEKYEYFQSGRKVLLGTAPGTARRDGLRSAGPARASLVPLKMHEHGDHGFRPN